MLDLETIHYRVLRILKENEDCRNSDKLLLETFYKKYYDVDIKFVHLENPVSIIRCRRKIQKLNPSLKGNSEVEEQREAHSKSYKSYFGQNNEQRGFSNEY